MSAEQRRVLPLGEAMLRASGGLKWSETPIGAIGAWVAESDFPLAPAISTAVRAAIASGLTGYLPPGIARQAETACAGWQQRYGWQVRPDQVHLVPDVTSALRIATEHLTPGVPMVLALPAYMPFLDLPGLIGRELITVEMTSVDGRYEWDLTALREALNGGGLLILTNPHNPTGRVFTAEEMRGVAEVVDECGATVFADEIHAPLVYPGAAHVPYASISDLTAAHTITATSASKGWNVPGLICAQILITGEALNERWRQMNPLVSHGVSPLGAVAAVAAYTDGADHLAGMIGYLDDGRKMFAQALHSAVPTAGFAIPEGTYLGWIDLRSTGLRPAEVADRALVLGVDGSECGAPGFLRINLATSHHTLVQLAQRLGRAVNALSSTAPPGGSL